MLASTDINMQHHAFEVNMNILWQIHMIEPVTQTCIIVANVGIVGAAS